MTADIVILSMNAMAVAFIHTVIGPDHYLPFIVMAKARKWSVSRTAMITFACGLGHVSSSVVLLLAGRWGLEWLPARRFARYNHVLAGGTIALSGVMIQFLGL